MMVCFFTTMSVRWVGYANKSFHWVEHGPQFQMAIRLLESRGYVVGKNPTFRSIGDGWRIFIEFVCCFNLF